MTGLLGDITMIDPSRVSPRAAIAVSLVALTIIAAALLAALQVEPLAADDELRPTLEKLLWAAVWIGGLGLGLFVFQVNRGAPWQRIVESGLGAALPLILALFLAWAIN